MLRFRNTLSGELEPFVPLEEGRVRIYACGPTVWNFAHIGNFKTFVFYDLLRRYLKFRGYVVTMVVNVTDVDDRIIEQTIEQKKSVAELTRPFEEAFLEDMATLNLERPEVMPRATEHIEDMVDLVETLERKGVAYRAGGSIYFHVPAFEGYGKLSRLDVSGMKAGARVDTDKYDKENARDFVLWKAKEDEPAWAQWDAPFGRGRPGWHIECSAMGMKYLGETFDIHCGGVDLIFPHHENEIAQSEAGTGKPFVRHWMHVEHLMVDNATMSKSKGNFYTLPDVLARGHSPEAIRYLLLAAHYRSQLNFTWEGLQHAAGALERIHGFARRLSEVEGAGPASDAVREAAAKASAEFDAALGDDLNTPEALAAVHQLVSDGNVLLKAGSVTVEGAAVLRKTLEEMNGVFAVLLPDEDRLNADEQALFDAREAARLRRDFGAADAARKQLEGLGIVLEDTPKGTRWRRKR